jgi:hypothetical protein
MTPQIPLFHEDINAALTTCVQALHGFKAVGVALRPELAADKAGRWLSDCLSASRRDKLDADQILWILRKARDVGCHAAMQFIARDAGYADPVPVDSEDEAADLERKFVGAVDTLAEMTKRIAALRARKRA